MNTTLSKFFFLLLLSFTLLSQGNSQGYKINVSIDNYDQDTLLLGYYYWDKQYIADTAVRSEGKFLFEDNDTLSSGVYLLITHPDNQFLQLVMPPDDQRFDLSLDYKNMSAPMEVEGSDDNRQFQEYISFLNSQRSKAETINTQFKEDTKGKSLALNQLDKDVQAYQDSIIQNFPNNMMSFVIKANKEVTIPEFSGTKEEIRDQQYRFYLKHFFDNMDLNDPRMLYSAFLHGKVNQYLKKAIVQIPDTINKSLDLILSKMEVGSDNYKRVMVHYLNDYANSEYVGMDAVYVHLVENYYATGKAPWVEEEQLIKMVDDAQKLKPLLIGKQAPDITVKDKDGAPVNLYGIDSAYTVLLFWAPDCGYCKKKMPKMIDIYPQIKERGAEIVAICTKLMDKEPSCWEYLQENNLEGMWINASDRYLRSRFKQLYNVTSTPQTFILNRDKKIVSKKINLEKIPQVLDMLIKMEKEERKK